ncbi:M1 family metallopeptidase [Compostibacter hankyongensis]|uniref:M1 family metallopeptidase n=1 Tax=Compostibacter hankyongensis TaxID=1007089 RepID=A0ABP8FSM8_9BACT
MYRFFIWAGLVGLTGGQAFAQTLYMPRNIKQAFDNGTRSPDGRPGKNYWQNYGRYHLSVTVTPPDPRVRGTESITYLNRSPDTLHTLVLRLVLNIHKPAAPRAHFTQQDYLGSGVHIDRLAIRGESLPVNSDDFGTWANIPLQQPLLPGDSIPLSMDWHYDLSVAPGREGVIDSTTFYLAYFYPRISVYDDYNGWDRLDFSDRQEFYNDFNDYTLEVKVPANYIVWATGTLQNPDEVLQPAYARKLEQSLQSDATIHMATLKELQGKKVTAQHAFNIWKWKASDVSDMALALSDHFVWDAAGVTVEKGRRVSVQAAYNDTAADFHHSVRWGRYALDWFSHHWPGVPYPYPKMTAFQGYADMEYPMMINDGTTPDTAFSRMVQDHEMAHTYFPFYMGTNETRYAFMDEGWATTYELLIGRTERAPEEADSVYRKFRVNRWIHDPASEEDLPIITPSNQLNGVGYGNGGYVKPSLAYLALKDLLGDDLFRKGLHAYMDRWHGRHPIPWDFFNAFNDATGRNLNWFWNSWFFSNNYIDLVLQEVRKSGKGYTLTIGNTGGFAVPVDVKLYYTDGDTAVFHQTPAIWQADQRQAKVTVPARKAVRAVALDGGIFMDAREADNRKTL